MILIISLKFKDYVKTYLSISLLSFFLAIYTFEFYLFYKPFYIQNTNKSIQSKLIKSNEIESTNKDLKIKSNEIESTNKDLKIKSNEIESTNKDLKIKSNEIESADKDLKIKSNEIESADKDLKIKSNEIENKDIDLKWNKNTILLDYWDKKYRSLS